jgi:4-diphosphocytidyl-2-C-methyl-D-erythritol kinase
MQGVGEVLTLLPPLPSTWLVQVNPGVAVPTPVVFAGLERRDNGPLSAIPDFPDTAALARWLAAQRNDLEPPAIAHAPVIAEVLAALAAQPGCLLVRMSGSGATVFGLFASAGSAETAAAALVQCQASWWVTTAAVLP